MLIIADNTSLNSLAGLASLTQVSWALEISDNPCLSQQEASSFAQQFNVQHSVDVSGNGTSYPCP